MSIESAILQQAITSIVLHTIEHKDPNIHRVVKSKVEMLSCFQNAHGFANAILSTNTCNALGIFGTEVIAQNLTKSVFEKLLRAEESVIVIENRTNNIIVSSSIHEPFTLGPIRRSEQEDIYKQWRKDFSREPYIQEQDFGYRKNRVNKTLFKELCERVWDEGWEHGAMDCPLGAIDPYNKFQTLRLAASAETQLRRTLHASIAFGASIEEPQAIKKAKINAPKYYGITPLEWAAQNGSLYTCRLLIEMGADPNSEYSQFSPVVLAHRYSHKEVVDYLIQEGASIAPLEDEIRLNYGHVSSEPIFNTNEKLNNALQRIQSLARLFR